MVLNKPIVFFDVETTGLSISEDRIIELFMMKVHPDGNRDSWYSLINPEGRQSSKEAIDKHGILNEDLEDQDTFSYLAPEILSFIQGCDLGGYNVMSFDLPLLAEEFLRAGVPFNHRDHKVLDSLAIYRHYEPRNLEAAYKKYTGKTLNNAHSAQADVEATVEIFFSQLGFYEIEGNVEDIERDTLQKEEMIDLAGKFKKRNGEVVINFGKHIGKNVKEVYKEDSGYLEWLSGANGFTKETRLIASKIISKLRAMNI